MKQTVDAVAARHRARLARALAEFWYNGAGPSHGELADAFAVVGVEPEDGSKRDRVSTAVRSVPDPDLFTLVDQLIELLRRSTLPHAEAAAITNLRLALKSFGFVLSDDFELTSAARPDLGRIPAQPAVREHIDRMQRALRDGDDAQMLGSSKELLESAAKVVLEATNQPIPAKFPALLATALEVLQIHPKAAPANGSVLEEPVKKILGGVVQIALGVNDLRGTYGTGHGGSAPRAKLGERQVRLAASAAVAVASFMLDTLDDPKAPWRRSPSAHR